MLQLNSRQNDFAQMPNYVFLRHIKNDTIRARVLKLLPRAKDTQLEELDEWIALSDKEQFALYADG